VTGVQTCALPIYISDFIENEFSNTDVSTLMNALNVFVNIDIYETMADIALDAGIYADLLEDSLNNDLPLSLGENLWA
jgi:hypothetical protein